MTGIAHLKRQARRNMRDVCRATVLVTTAVACAAFPLVTKPSGLGAARNPAAVSAARRLSHTQLLSRRPAGPRCALATEGQAVADGVAEAKVKLSPSQARFELERLAGSERWEKDAVVSVLSRIEREGGAQALFNSSAILFRKTTKGEVQMLTRGVIKPGTIDLNGDDDMEVLNQAFYATLLSSMVCAQNAGVCCHEICYAHRRSQPENSGDSFLFAVRPKSNRWISD